MNYDKEIAEYYRKKREASKEAYAELRRARDAGASRKELARLEEKALHKGYCGD